jgi:hypothetical protein
MASQASAAEDFASQGGEASQPSPSPQVQVHRHERRGLEWKDAFAKRRRVQDSMQDPVIENLRAARECIPDERCDVVFSDVAFLGMRNPDEVNTTMKK